MFGVLLACSSLAFTHALSVDERPSERQQHSSNSLVHCLVRLVPGFINTASLASLRLVFGLLATLTLSPECRGILWKVGQVPISRSFHSAASPTYCTHVGQAALNCVYFFFFIYVLPL